MATNIEVFDHLAGRIFAELYGEFPVKCCLSETEMGTYLCEKGTPGIEPFFDSFNDASLFAGSTIQWLESAGYIHCDSHTPSGECLSMLTAKGLEALKSVPDVLTGESLGNQLVEAAKAGTLDELKSLAGQAIGAGVRLGVHWVSTATQL